VRYDDRVPHAQPVERRRNPVGLGGEGVVRMLRARRTADAERFHDDRPVTGVGEERDERAESERRAEQARHQDHRVARSRHGDFDRLGR
jgi:hypothetical protein